MVFFSKLKAIGLSIQLMREESSKTLFPSLVFGEASEEGGGGGGGGGGGEGGRIISHIYCLLILLQVKCRS